MNWAKHQVESGQRQERADKAERIVSLNEQYDSTQPQTTTREVRLEMKLAEIKRLCGDVHPSDRLYPLANTILIAIGDLV